MFEKTVQGCEVKKGGHKEEGENQRKLDAADRNEIIEELRRNSNPLRMQPEKSLTNIINGRIASDEVNVDKVLDIGHMMAAQFMAALPHGFHNPIKKQVVTMEMI